MVMWWVAEKAIARMHELSIERDHLEFAARAALAKAHAAEARERHARQGLAALDRQRSLSARLDWTMARGSEFERGLRRRASVRRKSIEEISALLGKGK